MKNKKKLQLISGLSELELKWLGIKADLEGKKIRNFYYDQKYETFVPNFRWK